MNIILRNSPLLNLPTITKYTIYDNSRPKNTLHMIANYRIELGMLRISQGHIQIQRKFWLYMVMSYVLVNEIKQSEETFL